VGDRAACRAQRGSTRTASPPSAWAPDSGRQRAAPKIDRAQHYHGLLEAGVGREDEQVLGRFVADRLGPNPMEQTHTVNHDVATQGLAPATVLRCAGRDRSRLG